MALKLPLCNSTLLHKINVLSKIPVPTLVCFFTLVSPSLGADSLLSPEQGIPPTYRKVTLAGRPLSGPKPQNFADSDAEPEETFVDALTLRLQSRTSDIYIPVGEEEFALTVNRNIQSANWEEGKGIVPRLRPDLPFGNCWTTGLAANLCLIKRGDDSPMDAIVTDEEGTIHRFVSPATESTERLIPVPNSLSQQDVVSFTLKKNENGNYVLRRKFGVTLTFVPTSSITLTAGNEKRAYFRLEKAEDKFGFAMVYHFASSNTTLVPNEIDCQGLILRIYRNKRGLIDRIVDPAGGSRLYRYRNSTQAGGLPLLIETKKQIASWGREIVEYEYDETTSQPTNQRTFHHCDIATISSKQSNTYQFSYQKHPADLAQPKARDLRTVQLPGKFGTTTFSRIHGKTNPSDETLTRTFVTDAVGNGVLYEFSGNGTKDLRFGDRPLARFAVHSSQSISYFQSSHWKLDKSSNRILAKAPSKLLGKESYHFSLAAGGALSKAIDMHGNTWQFEHQDSFPETHFGEETSHPLATVRSDPTLWTTPSGHKTTQTYSERFRLPVEKVNPLGRVEVWERDAPLENVSSYKLFATKDEQAEDNPFQHTDYRYEDRKKLVSATQKIIRKTKTTPEPLEWETDLFETYEINEMGLAAKTILGPKDNTYEITFLYDRNGNLRSRRYQNGYHIDFKYNAVNQLISVFEIDSGPDRITSKRTYGPRGLETLQDEDGKIEAYEYDKMGRKIKTTHYPPGDFPDRPGLVKQSTFNAMDSEIQGVDEDGNTYTATYDALQRCTHIAYSDSTSYTYNYGKNCGNNLFASSSFVETSADYSEDPYVTIYEYDESGRNTSQSRRNKKTEKDTLIESYDFDALGNHTLTKSPKKGDTRMIYDPLNRVIRTVYPNGKSTQTLYTSTGLKYAFINKAGMREDTVYDSHGDPVQ